MRNRWNEKGWSYDETGAHGIHSQADKEEWIQLFQDYQGEGLEVLDVGTGTGYLALIAAKLGHCATAIDWSATMLEQAQAKALEKNLKINFIEGVTEELPFADNCFHVLTARHVLWTLSDPDQALAEWFRVVKPGGRVWADFTPRSEEGKNHHYDADIESKLPLNKNIAPDEIVELLTNAGFQEIQVIQMSNKADHHHPHQNINKPHK